MPTNKKHVVEYTRGNSEDGNLQQSNQAGAYFYIVHFLLQKAGAKSIKNWFVDMSGIRIFFFYILC